MDLFAVLVQQLDVGNRQTRNLRERCTLRGKRVVHVPRAVLGPRNW